MDKDALNAIARMIDAAEAGSEAIDSAIMPLFYRREQRHIGCTCFPECCPDSRHVDSVWVDPATDRWVLMGTAFHFSTDLAAALKLTEKALPGVWWKLGKGKTHDQEPLYGCLLYFGEEEIGQGEHDFDPALALLAALTDALINDMPAVFRAHPQ